MWASEVQFKAKTDIVVISLNPVKQKAKNFPPVVSVPTLYCISCIIIAEMKLKEISFDFSDH